MSTEEPTEAPREDKQVSNPFSTGGGGLRFEVQVQSAFAALMLAGGFAPCLPCLPIRKIRLQGRHAGYAIDDLVVYISDSELTNELKLLVQVKHSLSFTEADTTFGEVIKAAWTDFNNSTILTRERDAIALVTGPLSALDIDATRWILEWARSRSSPVEFFGDVDKAKFSSNEKRKKLAAFRSQINAAAGAVVGDDEVFTFLRHFHVVGYDLDVRCGLMHALLHSIIGRHNPQISASIWARIQEEVASANQNAGTLTVDTFPEDIRLAFTPRPIETIPVSLASMLAPKATLDWNVSEFADALVVANLLGRWRDGPEADMAIVAALTPDMPSEWLRKMREVLQRPESPLSHANGVWIVRHRVSLWGSLASRIFGEMLNRFQDCAVKVLSERDPMFELEPEQRFAARIYGELPAYSPPLRIGIAETLALLGTNMAQLPNCDPSAGEGTATVAVREIFDEADWKLWASLNGLLPTLAEAAPNAFLEAVEKALLQQPCPYDAIFAQERDAFSGGNHITGLLWALETLAWEETHIVRVSAILAMLAARDPGGNWGNRPANSLTTILLPWFPQTRAAIEKRIVAVKTVIRERREVGWRLLMSLLPRHHSTSTGTSKPKWRNKLDSDEVPRPTNQEYWDQVTSYSQLAVEFVRTDPDKLKELIDSLDSLPEPAFNAVLEFTESDAVTALPDERRLPIWAKMSSFVRKHRRYADANWALPAEIVDNNPYIRYDYTPDRTRAGPQRFLCDYKGYLQADAYGGYDGIYHKGSVIEVACWAHARRKFFDARETDGRRATQMLAMVAELYAVEDAAREKIELLLKQNPNALRPEQEQIRLALRQEKSKPILAKIKTWLDTESQLVLPRSPMAQAINYTLNQWDALNRYTEQDHLNIDNNAAERALKRVAIGRKNWLFAGHDEAGASHARLYTLIASAERHGVDPQAYLTSVLAKIGTTPMSELNQFLPDVWKADSLAQSPTDAPRPASQNALTE